MSRVKTWFSGLSLISKVAIVSTAAIISIGVIGAAAQPDSNTTTPAVTPAPIIEISEPKIEVKPVSTTETIPYKSTDVDDSSLEQGVRKTRTVGENGTLTHTYQVTYTDGVETSRSGPVDTITTPAVDEVVAVGTKVLAPICSNGSYINSAGNTVCSPSSNPAGASAKCRDGTYSYSQSRRGTCSSHGGVATWL